MSLFSKKAPDDAPTTMKVYRATRPGATNTLLAQPGKDAAEADNDRWFRSIMPPTMSPLYKDGPIKMAHVYTVTFTDGVAEVDRPLGEWLLRRKLAFKRPQKPLEAISSATEFPPPPPRPAPIVIS